MKVRDIMTTGVETASPDSSLQEIARMMKDEDVGAIPIVDGDELAGIITDRDIVVRCIAAGQDPSEISADDVISEDLETVEPDDEVDEASRIMSERQIRRLPVCEGGRLVGMISIGDIAVKHDERRAGKALEDISEGVKGRGAQRRSATGGKRQPALAESGKALTRRGPQRDYESELASAGSASRDIGSARGRQAESARGRNQGTATGRGAASTRGKVQAISNRASGDEMERQRRVNPQRAASGSSGRNRRKAS